MPQWQALCISMAVEAATVFLVMALVLGQSRRNSLLGAFAIASATLITHPFAWMLNRDTLASLAFPMRASIIEVLVVVAEAFILALVLPISRRHGFMLAAIANAVSFFGGLLILNALSSH